MPDSRERVSGTIIFTGNIEVPGMLHGKLLRSPHAHARLLKVDASRRRGRPGCRTVTTGQDLVDAPINSHYGPVFPDRPLLAIDRVRYRGSRSPP